MSGPAAASAIAPAIHDDNDPGVTLLAQAAAAPARPPAGQAGLMS